MGLYKSNISMSTLVFHTQLKMKIKRCVFMKVRRVSM